MLPPPPITPPSALGTAMPHPTAAALRTLVVDHGTPLLLLVDVDNAAELRELWPDARPLLVPIVDGEVLDREDDALHLDASPDRGGATRVLVPWEAIFAVGLMSTGEQTPFCFFESKPAWMGADSGQTTRTVQTILGRIGRSAPPPPWSFGISKEHQADPSRDQPDKRRVLDTIYNRLGHCAELLVRDGRSQANYLLQADAELDIGGMQLAFTHVGPGGQRHRRQVRWDKVFAIRAPWAGVGALWPQDASDAVRRVLDGAGAALSDRAGVPFTWPSPAVTPRVLQSGPGANPLRVLQSLDVSPQKAHILVDPARVKGPIPDDLAYYPVLIISLGVPGLPARLKLSGIRIEATMYGPSGPSRLSMGWDAVFAVVTDGRELWSWPDAYPTVVREALLAGHRGAPPAAAEVGFEVHPPLPNGYLPVSFAQPLDADVHGSYLHVGLALPPHPDDLET